MQKYCRIVSFEWLHNRTQSTDLNVGTALHVDSIIDSERERVTGSMLQIASHVMFDGLLGLEDQSL